jgi:hypothetical protein
LTTPWCAPPFLRDTGRDASRRGSRKYIRDVMYGGYEALMFSADKVKIIATSITIDCVWSFAVD